MVSSSHGDAVVPAKSSGSHSPRTFGASTRLAHTTDGLREKDIIFWSPTEAFGNDRPAGPACVPHMFGALAEFERKLTQTHARWAGGGAAGRARRASVPRSDDSPSLGRSAGLSPLGPGRASRYACTAPCGHVPYRGGRCMSCTTPLARRLAIQRATRTLICVQRTTASTTGDGTQSVQFKNKWATEIPGPIGVFPR
jgi:hypothetical protein